MLRYIEKMALVMVALLVVTAPLGSTGAPGAAQAVQAGAVMTNMPIRATITDLHLIAFSRDIVSR